jgi:hypothetical protein
MRSPVLCALLLGSFLAPRLLAAPPAAPAKTTGHIAGATITLTPHKTDPVMVLAYQCDVAAGAAKIKSPVIAFQFAAARDDGGLVVVSGWLRRGAKETEDLVEYGLAQEKSRAEPLVPAEKLHGFKGRIRHHPSVQFGLYGRLVAYRVELWQDGELLNAFNSKPAGELKAANLPDDWYRKVGIIGATPAGR